MKNIHDELGTKDFELAVKIVENGFSFIIENIVPQQFCQLLDDVDKPIRMQLNELFKFNKMHKFQKTEFKKENSVSYIEEKLSKCNLDQGQFDFIKN